MFNSKARSPESLHTPLVIIGPSGSGKSSLVHRLQSKGIVRVEASWTDRRMREGEEAIEHVFIDSETFRQRKLAGFFIDTVQPFSLPYQYGLPRLEFDNTKVTLVMLRFQFLGLFAVHYPTSTIYHIEAPRDRVERELEARRDADLGTRLADYDLECEQGHQLADRVFTNDSTLEQLETQVTDAIAEDYYQ